MKTTDKNAVFFMVTVCGKGKNMTLSQLLVNEGIADFAALELKNCAITKERLISDAPKDCFAVMTVLPYPRNTEGRFAAFSVIPDYHIFFAELENKLTPWFEEKYPDAYVKVFADHSPIDERLAACCTGLGVKGDNGLFISEKYGSFVFLGEIICSLSERQLSEEGISVRFEKVRGCSHCGACEEACPAGAVGGDKSLCVSSLTQKKGNLSDSERCIIKKSGYVWGCDVCAKVCPMNEGAKVAFSRKEERKEKRLDFAHGQNPAFNSDFDGETSDSAETKNDGFIKYSDFFTRNVISPESYRDIEALSDEEYAAYPFSWRKKEILKRNFDIFDKN